MRARQMKAVKADHEEEIEHHLAPAHGDTPPLGRIWRRLPPRSRAAGPTTNRPGAARARRLARNDKAQVPVDIGLELVAAPREDDEVRNLLRPLVELPVFFVAQRSGVSPSAPAILSSSETMA